MWDIIEFVVGVFVFVATVFIIGALYGWGYGPMRYDSKTLCEQSLPRDQNCEQLTYWIIREQNND